MNLSLYFFSFSFLMKLSSNFYYEILLHFLHSLYREMQMEEERIEAEKKRVIK